MLATKPSCHYRHEHFRSSLLAPTESRARVNFPIQAEEVGQKCQAGDAKPLTSAELACQLLSKTNVGLHVRIQPSGRRSTNFAD
jgi:hypothetical protein